jgi:hypothetical protein
MASSDKDSLSTTQQVVSLLIVLHLFCVIVALSSYTRRSPLQMRLLNLLAPYTRTLNIAPASAPFHLTQYDALTGEFEHDDEHYLELTITTPDGQTETHNLNVAALAFPDARRRYRSFATEMVYAQGDGFDGENRLAELAKAAAGYGLRRWNADTGVLRLKHHLSQPRLLENLQEGFPDDPRDERYLVTRYEADVLLDEDGEVQLIKREAKEQVAPVINPPAAPAKQESTP